MTNTDKKFVEFLHTTLVRSVISAAFYNRFDSIYFSFSFA